MGDAGGEVGGERRREGEGKGGEEGEGKGRGEQGSGFSSCVGPLRSPHFPVQGDQGQAPDQEKGGACTTCSGPQLRPGGWAPHAVPLQLLPPGLRGGGSALLPQQTDDLPFPNHSLAAPPPFSDLRPLTGVPPLKTLVRYPPCFSLVPRADSVLLTVILSSEPCPHL